MKGRGDWLILGILVAISGLLVLVSSSRQGDSPEHGSNNDGFHGTSALRLLAGAYGHPTAQLDLAFNPHPGGLLVILTPTAPFTAGEAQALADYVRSGGIALYADEQLDPRVAAQFHLRLSAQPIPTAAGGIAPVLANVRHVGDDTTSRYWVAGPEQAILLRHQSGFPLAIETRLGSGSLIALSSPCLLCNGFLRQNDNAILAADLLALAPGGGTVLFDEYHHGALAGGSGGDWTQTPYGIAIGWAVIVLFAGLAIRGRAFGPRLPAPGTGERSSAEYAVAVGHLLRQAGGRRLALGAAQGAARRRLSERLGLRRDMPPDAFLRALQQRAPEAARQYSEALAEGGLEKFDEARLLAAARRLHDLAYPIGRAAERDTQR